MDDSFRIFVSIAAAIVLEAVPFLALGSLLSALVEVFVSSDRLARMAPRSLAGRVAAGVGAGLVLPTCECGVVPVARRLLSKGMPPPSAIAYLLAAPILNPVVLASTFVAFRGEWGMVGARAAVAVLVAGSAALLVRRTAVADVVRGAPPDAEHAHAPGSRVLAVGRHAAHDFLEMGKYLVLGACAAAAIKTLAPADAFGMLHGSTLASVTGMMALAVLLSVCSEADAFVAASFVTLPAAAHLAFVTLGPMVDLKLVALYAATFRKRVFWILVIVPTVLVFALCMAYGALS